jgi:copper amine oxidase-like protein
MIHALTFATYAVTLNGRPVLSQARAAVVDGRVLLPVRALGEALGADVSYDAPEMRIVVQRGHRIATLPARGAVRIVAGHAYAPLRAVAAAFGLDVAYVAHTRTVALGDRHVAGNDAQSVTYAAPPTETPRALTYTVATTPGNGASVHEPYPQIGVRFAGVASIDRRSLRVMLDDRDVSADAALIGDQVLYTPRSALAPGRHAVAVTASASGGMPLAVSWTFDDSFAFVAPPPPTPFPIRAISLDRWVAPGTTAFDVVVNGAPGLTGFVGVEGIPGIFPLTVSTYDTYVAHVVVPSGVHQPFARIAARITLPGGAAQTIVLPQTIGLFTPPAPPQTAKPIPVTRTAPGQRSVNVPSAPPSTASPAASPSPSPAPRRHVRPRSSPTPTPSR